MESATAPKDVTLKPKAPPAPLLQTSMAAKQVIPLGGRHVTLFEDKITVRDMTGESEALPRRYTLTHRDCATEMLLSVGAEYDQEALGRPETRAMSDEVLAELSDGDQPRLLVRCLVEGPELAGRAIDPGRRRRIFEKEMPFALAVLRYGDRFFFERHPELDQAPVTVEFQSTDPRFQARRGYGRITEYRVTRIAGESRRLVVGAAAVAVVGLGAFVLGKLRNRGG